MVATWQQSAVGISKCCFSRLPAGHEKPLTHSHTERREKAERGESPQQMPPALSPPGA